MAFFISIAEEWVVDADLSNTKQIKSFYHEEHEGHEKKTFEDWGWRIERNRHHIIPNDS